MKKYLLILLALPLFGLAQEGDWFPIPSDQSSYYKLKSPGIHALQAMRMDSIIQTDSGVMYYNYRTPESIGYNGGAIIDPMSSWLGYYALIKENKAIFKSIDQKPILIEYSKGLHDSWQMYADSVGNYIIASFDSIDYIEIVEGLYDSVKYLHMNAYHPDGTIDEDFDSSIRFILSKDYGFVDVYNLHIFPTLRIEQLVGIEINDEQYGFKWNYDDMVSSYQVGDEIVLAYMFYDNVRSYKKFEYVDKVWGPNYVEYKVRTTDQNYSSMVLSTKRYYLGLMPGQSVFSYQNIGPQGYTPYYLIDTVWENQNQYNYFKRNGDGIIEHNGIEAWEVSMGQEVRYKVNHSHDFRFYQGSGPLAYEMVSVNSSDYVWGEPILIEVEDYQVLRPEMTAYYTRSSTSSISAGDIKAIKIDSILDHNYYNVRTPEVIASDEDYYYYNPFSSWIGTKTRITESESVFENMDGQLIYINKDEEIGTPWLFFLEDYSAYIEAEIAMIDEIEILDGLIDSVKYITFQAYDESGSAVDNSINNDTLILSKKYGWVSTFYWAKFTMDNHLKYTLMGLEKQDGNYGFEWNYDELVSAYELDDVIQMQLDDTFAKKDLYINKSISDDFAEYTILRCNSFSANLDTIYKKFPLKLLPGQTYFGDEINGMGFSSYKRLSTEFIGSNQYSVKEYDNFIETEWNGEKIWAREPFISTSDYPTQLCNEYHYFCTCSNADGESYEITYLKTTDEEWGNPISFPCTTSTKEISFSNINISPNPSNGILKIMNNSSQKIEEIKIINTNGQVIWSQKTMGDNQQIDISKYPAGLYLIKMQLEENQIVNEKILLQK